MPLLRILLTRMRVTLFSIASTEHPTVVWQTYLGVFTAPVDAPAECSLRIYLEQEQIRGSPFVVGIQ